MPVQGSNSQQLSPGEQKALRQQREAKIAELSRELDQVAHAASSLQERLKPCHSAIGEARGMSLGTA